MANNSKKSLYFKEIFLNLRKKSQKSQKKNPKNSNHLKKKSQKFQKSSKNHEKILNKIPKISKKIYKITKISRNISWDLNLCHIFSSYLPLAHLRLYRSHVTYMLFFRSIASLMAQWASGRYLGHFNRISIQNNQVLVRNIWNSVD